MMFFGGVPWVMLVLAGACASERWRWPEDNASAPSVRIDTKVRFIDNSPTKQWQNAVQADEIKEPSNTDGFYNRPSGTGSGRYRVRSERHQQDEARNSRYSDGTLDSLQYCKCVSTPDCTPRTDLPNACASGMHLCCYKRPSKNIPSNSEYFNELDDERPMILPNYEGRPSPFPTAPAGSRPVLVGPQGPTGKIGPEQPKKFGAIQQPVLIGPDGPTGVIGLNQRNPGVLVGPEGPTGVIGPNHRNDRLLSGPGGPTGVIGPNHRDERVFTGPGGPTGNIGPNQRNPGVLVGPHGPTGHIGPNGSSAQLEEESAQRGVLVGPGGPTGVYGPQQYGQRGVLTGPGGPTGLIGSGGRSGRRQGVLVGPGGPTGMIGPYGFQRGRSAHPGLLVGPDGPTGIIGPGRRLLVGPGGPTGQIGPRGYGQFGF